MVRLTLSRTCRRLSAHRFRASFSGKPAVNFVHLDDGVAGVERSEPPAIRTPVELAIMAQQRQHCRNYNEPRHAHELTFSCYKGFKFLQAERTCKWLAESPDWIPRITRKRGKKTERLYWQSGGGFDRNVIRPDTLMSMIDYVHMNPVRRGLVEKSEEWKWSSATWYSGAGEPFIVPDPIPPEWLGGVS